MQTCLFISLSKRWIKSRSSRLSFRVDVNGTKTDHIPPLNLLNQMKINPKFILLQWFKLLYQCCSTSIKHTASVCDTQQYSATRTAGKWLYFKGQSIPYLKPLYRESINQASPDSWFNSNPAWQVEATISGISVADQLTFMVADSRDFYTWDVATVQLLLPATSRYRQITSSLLITALEYKSRSQLLHHVLSYPLPCKHSSVHAGRQPDQGTVSLEKPSTTREVCFYSCVSWTSSPCNSNKHANLAVELVH